MLHVKNGMEKEFEEAFRMASKIISRCEGYQSHQIQRCLEVPNKYVLLVQWRDLESHTVSGMEKVIAPFL
jgi:heme-degrading monooxygenase HmoA